MAALVELVSSYVPMVVQRRFEQDPRPLQKPEVHRCRGSLLFLDIAGFSSLAESLADSRDGTEELTRVLNGYFERVITTVTEHGGDIIKLAGDSIVALWEADADFGVAGAVMRAAECGVAARRAVIDTATAHPLEVRGALAVGDVGTMFLGGIGDRWELLLVGDAMVQIAAAVKQAAPGQLVASAEAWPMIDGRFAGRPLAGGMVEVVAATRALGAKSQPVPDLAPEAQQALLNFLPEGIKARLLAGQSGWLAEMRRVSVIFINLPDWDQSALALIKRTQVVMSALQTTIAQFEGTINKLTVDDKGVTMLAVLGLPPLAHEDDAARAVRCALAIQAQLRELSVRSAIGVSTGRVYCGSVGTARRREYTVIGSVVNLAARLMQSAPGDVLCDEATHAAAGNQIRFEALAPIAVKGRSAPVKVYRPFSRAIGDRAARPMFGRTAELQALTARLDALVVGARATVVIEGDAGMGKSRLVTELGRESAARAITFLTAGGNAIDRANAYHAWRPVFAALFGLEELGDAINTASARAAVLEQLADIEMRQLAPLINGVLPIELADNDLTESMTGAVRSENTHELLLRILENAARRKPLVIALEDVQWMDSASIALARFVARRLQPALFIITVRPSMEPLAGELRDLLAVADARLRLDALDHTDAARLIANSLGVAAVADRALELIGSRAQGHPFFSEQLALALRDTGVLRVDGDTCIVSPEVDLHAIALPDRVEQVVIGRLDRLTPGQQITLKVASVIGLVFAFRILRDVHPIEPDRPHLPEYLNAFTQADFAAIERSEPDLTYVFKHFITQQVAYNLMLSSQRRQLHKAVADWYVATFAADPAPYYAVIAYHYKRAEDPERGLHFADLAARDAVRKGAYREAVGFLEDALAFDAHLNGTDAVRRARWEMSLADAYIGIGDVANSRLHIAAAMALLGAPPPRSTAAQIAGVVAQSVVQLAHVVRPRAFQKATRQARELAESAALASERLGHLCYFDANLPLGLYAAIRSVNLAEQSGAPAALGRAYADMAMAMMVLGLKRQSEHYCRKAEALVDSISDTAARAWTHQLAGVYASSMAQFERARTHLDRAIQIAQESRDFRREEESTIQRTLVSYQSADFQHAWNCAETVRELAGRRGHQQEQLWSTQLAALCLSRLGRVEEAARLSARVLPEQIHAMGRTEQITHYGAHALCHARAGDLTSARRAVEFGVAALRRQHPMVSFDLEGSASLVEALIELIAAEQDAAARTPLFALADQAMPYLRAAARVFPVGVPRFALWSGALANVKGAARPSSLQKAIDTGTAMGMPYEPALAHLQLARMTGDLPEGQAHAAVALETFARLNTSFDRARAEALARR